MDHFCNDEFHDEDDYFLDTFFYKDQVQTTYDFALQFDETLRFNVNSTPVVSEPVTTGRGNQQNQQPQVVQSEYYDC
jgi:hypothetical protein